MFGRIAGRSAVGYLGEGGDARKLVESHGPTGDDYVDPLGVGEEAVRRLREKPKVSLRKLAESAGPSSKSGGKFSQSSN